MTVQELIDKLKRECEERQLDTTVTDICIVDEEKYIYPDFETRYEDNGIDLPYAVIKL